MTRNFTLANVALSSRDLMREIGLLVRERVVRRTRAGQSATGQAFKPYSPGYAMQKARSLGGGTTVNLTVSGAMVNALTVLEVTETSVSVGY